MRRPLTDLIYPPRCVVCQDIALIEPTDAGSRQVCTRCKPKLSFVTGAQCMQCGKMLGDPDEEYCFSCKKNPKTFRRGFPVFQYTEDMQAGITAMKYHDRKEYASFYVNAILNRYGEELKKIPFDAVIPVPIHKSKLKKRGYNQTELLAKPLARKLGIPYYPEALIRVQATTPQKELSARERLENLKGAFLFAQNDVKLNTVLLVDDIYTTGATIEACSQVLRDGGVSEIYYVSVCISAGYA